MPFCLRPRSRKVVSLCLLYSLSFVMLIPFAPARARGNDRESTEVNLPQQTPPHRSNELLVRFRSDAAQVDRELAGASVGVRLKERLTGESAVEKFELTGAGDVVSAALQLNLNPSVEFAEPNFIVKGDQYSLTANDTRFPEQWALSNTGQNGGNYGSDIAAVSAWQSTQGSANTVIAVIDSGIDFNHPDLTNNQWTNPAPTMADLHGWDFITDSGTIKDEQGHGTAVAGIIAAQGNNALGVSGVMWHASLMSLRVLDETGTGDVADAVEAIDYAVAHGAQVINLSWGTEGASIALKDAIDRALRRGVVVVCSAGNTGRNVDDPASAYYPAAFNSPGLIAVAASDNRDQLLSWSNFGSTHVAVAAPGQDLLTTQMGGGYWSISGTSAAAPLVSGVVGLMKTLRPVTNATQVKTAIIDSVRPSMSLAGKVQSGGVIDAAKSIAALLGGGNQMRVTPGPRYGSGGTGPGGSFNTTPPPVTTGAPNSNLPNLDQLRNSTPPPPITKAPIQSNLICADCDPQGGGGGGGYYPSGDPNFSTARRRPVNETGQQGVDLGSRNFNWSLPLASLPGRAGLDLNLTLFYNSLVWTKDGSYIKYNGDLGSPAPGFSLGLPKLQQRFLNSQTGIYAYMMVTPSGGRVELRQIGSSNIYESQDVSYTQLDATNPNALLVRTSDGTQFTFVPVTINSEYRCTQIKDRNGNYISASYDSTNGHLQTVTDTLGRVVTFVYDGNSNLTTIRQTWAGAAHNWATFSYGQVYVAPGFGGGLLVNGPNNNYVTVLTQVNLHDGSYFTFNYNAAFGQVNRINHYASDGHLLSYTSYNVDSSAGQTDCPRFTERRDWVENWNNNAEAVTGYSVATDGSWSQETAPDGTLQKEFFATTGWQNGLTTSTEIWSGGIKKKWTTVSWTQDDVNLSYQKNPRVTETNIYDAEGNRKRTHVNYTSFSLPSDVYEYAADATTLLRRQHIDYRWDDPFISRRIIGLPDTVSVYEGSGALASKIAYGYDWADSRHFTAVGPSMQHDSTNYGAGFVYGRGNLTGIARYNVNDLSQLIWVALYGYDMSGSVVQSRDGLDRLTTIDYSDSYSDGNNSRNMRAYPTKITDPDGYFSTAQYNYDFGAVTRTQDPKGAAQSITYDNVGRVDRVTNLVNNAYSRFVYWPTAIQNFTTIQDNAGEAYSVQLFDGAGRLYKAASDHPGSVGLYRGTDIVYDVMGRVFKRSNPTEMNSSWVPAGDDAAGWVYTQQLYDWKGRPTLTTFPDGSTRENTYGGCGCAGGEVTTVRDERGRRRKLTNDVLGRLKQVDELNFDQTVYSTTTYSYNTRDQITQSNQAGQIRSFGYDGHGRLQSRTTPEQGITSYSYFADDATQTVTDARGATMTFAYNGRHLPTSITYGAPAGVAATPNVSFGYDATGNRTSMTDGLGSVSYVYNTLSQLTSETRTFTGLGSYTLSYGYNLAGELNSITGPSQFGSVNVGYSYDATGRPTSVSGANYAGVSSYVNSISYRAFGIKQMSYGNGRTLSLGYDNRLRPTQYSIPGALRLQYEYGWENSGRAEFVRNLDDQTLDRWFAYDHVGRLIVSRSGTEARVAFGEQIPVAYDGPYSQGYAYDVWGNRTHIEGWGGVGRWADYTYTNNRRNGMQYDAAGNITNDGGQNFSYDATGQQASASYTGYLLQQYYDGDGRRVKKKENSSVTYYLRSSVLGGQVVAEIDSGGTWTRGFVYQGSSLIAVQQNGVYWTHQDPVAKSQRLTDVNGNVVSTIELDPFGADTNRSSNSAFQPRQFTSYTRDNNGADDAMFRRYNRWWAAFDQPDPYDGSYSLGDPQSFNRYTYVQNDPVNFVDPTGLLKICFWTITTNAEGFEDGIALEQCIDLGPTGLIPGLPGGGGDVTPQNTDPEKPCREGGGAVSKDIDKIAKSIGGEAKKGSFVLNQDFPGAVIDTKGQSFESVVSSLRQSGFEPYLNLKHVGYSFKTSRPRESGLWYHVVVAEPTQKKWVYRGHEASSREADTSKPPESVTIHCHGTDPNGWDHIIDTLNKEYWWLKWLP